MYDTRLIVYVTAGKRENLSLRQQHFRQAVEELVMESGLRLLDRMHGSDRVDERYEYVSSCNGVIILAMSQWKAKHLNRKQKKDAFLPSEFTQMAAVMATVAGRPLLVLRETHVAQRGAFRRGYIHPIVDMPSSLDPEWLKSGKFNHEFQKWIDDVNQFHHVFLGYSAQAEPVASLIREFLRDEMKLRVFDWHEFRPGGSIWDAIKRAERRTHAGIFLFTADDKINAGLSRQIVPRDNVIYEAGYFAGAKDRKHALVIREQGAKLPSDLGGVICQS